MKEGTSSPPGAPANKSEHLCLQSTCVAAQQLVLLQVDSCMSCDFCKSKEEQYCATGSIFTYGGVTKYGRAGPDGVPTAGGYSDKMTVNEHFGIKVHCFFLRASFPLDSSPCLFFWTLACFLNKNSIVTCKKLMKYFMRVVICRCPWAHHWTRPLRSFAPGESTSLTDLHTRILD